ncbi:MAG: acyl-CoA thioesterase [Actinomycetota bacterium]|nr:acyl-CoA thioesterase [Actinomycetota bacterium]
MVRDRPGGFVWFTSIFFDELDPLGLLHNSRYAVLVERAKASFNRSQGRNWELDPAPNPDQFYVIREQSFAFLRPIRGTGEIGVHMWLDRLGTTSVTWWFEISSAAGLHATASRTIVKLDAQTHRPAPWSESVRKSYALIARSSPALIGDAPVIAAGGQR